MTSNIVVSLPKEKNKPVYCTRKRVTEQAFFNGHDFFGQTYDATFFYC
ncbi:hypothetical protein CIT292_07510 [Citrobacter youngae ATCC 29220]|uniref:Uncharacterized protein n=1 Tax=Citrobacter youngae ATCC 29220 TaxID=500640 RepID=D4BAL5_9ENTR|nr:hypothetical protein CIT292_07510 [Citrobacter youngae ATCC 29220]